MPATATKAQKSAKNGKPAKVPAVIPNTPDPDVTASGPSPRWAVVREAADLLKLAGDANRLSILLMLVGGPMKVGDICARLGQQQPATSHNLSILRHARLVTSQKVGKESHYHPTDLGRRLVEAVRLLV